MMVAMTLPHTSMILSYMSLLVKTLISKTKIPAAAYPLSSRNYVIVLSSYVNILLNLKFDCLADYIS